MLNWTHWLPSNLLYKTHKIAKLKCFSSRLTVLFAQSIEVEHENVVGAAPTGDAPTTPEWSTRLLPTKGRIISEVWQYVPVFKIRSETCWTEAQFCENLYMIKKESLPNLAGPTQILPVNVRGPALILKTDVHYQKLRVLIFFRSVRSKSSNYLLNVMKKMTENHSKLSRFFIIQFSWVKM